MKTMLDTEMSGLGLISSRQEFIDTMFKKTGQACETCGAPMYIFKDNGKSPICFECGQMEHEGINYREQEAIKMTKQATNHEKQKMLLNSSYMPNTGTKLLEKTFNDFEVYPNEQEVDRKILSQALIICERIKSGNIQNFALIGAYGVGKTLLASAMLTDINNSSDPQQSCMFVSVPALMDLELSSRLGNVNPSQRDEFIQKRNLIEASLAKADVVVFDDLGSETTLNAGGREANDTVQKAFFNILEARNDKVNIITTNKDGKALKQIYNGKIISRLLTHHAENVINFKGLKDKRNG